MEDLYRYSSEEIFLKYFVESSNGVPAPSMEMLGFKNLSQSFRHADSEELFKSLLTNGENKVPTNPEMEKLLARSFKCISGGSRKNSPSPSLMAPKSCKSIEDCDTFFLKHFGCREQFKPFLSE